MKQSETIIMVNLPEEQLWENLKISNDFIFVPLMLLEKKDGNIRFRTCVKRMRN